MMEVEKEEDQREGRRGYGEDKVGTIRRTKGRFNRDGWKRGREEDDGRDLPCVCVCVCVYVCVCVCECVYVCV